MQSFVPGTGAQHPVQVKGSRLAQFSGASPLSTGYYLTQMQQGISFAVSSPFGELLKTGGKTK